MSKDRLAGLVSLKNMRNLVATWPVEKRSDFYKRVERLQEGAETDTLQAMALMYAGLNIETGRRV